MQGICQRIEQLLPKIQDYVRPDYKKQKQTTFGGVT